MTLLYITLFIFLSCYLMLLLWFSWGFVKTHTFKVNSKHDLPLTIIICARNEEKNIARCLTSILKQEYNRDQLQIIVINDASSDTTVTQAESVLKNSGVSYQVISNPVRKGKKQSISYAIQFANHEWIILRDADTFTLSTKWLSAISNYFYETKSDLIIGPVAISNNQGLLWALQAVENNVLSVISCGSAFYKKAFLCSGANLSFSKRCFERTNGYASHAHISSGDDILFLEDVKKHKDLRIGYLKSPAAIVFTYPCYSFPALIKQKIRWAAKFKFNSNFLNLFVALLIFIINASWLFSFAAAYYDAALKNVAMLFILIKLCIDILLLFLASGFIKNKKSSWYALPVACIYPVYAVIVSTGSLFFKPKWK